jgi:hypothetical protein
MFSVLTVRRIEMDESEDNSRDILGQRALKVAYDLNSKGLTNEAIFILDLLEDWNKMRDELKNA